MPDTPPPMVGLPDRSLWDEGLDALEYAWGPLLVAAIFAAALALPDATHEVLAVVIDDPFQGEMAGLFRALATLLLCIYAPIALHIATRQVLDLPRASGPAQNWVDRQLLTFIPRLPLAGGLGAVLTMLTSPQDELTGHVRLSLWGLLIYLLLGVLSGLPSLMPDRRWQALCRDYEAGQLGWAGLVLRVYRFFRDRLLRWHRFAYLLALVLLGGAAFRPGWAGLLGPLGVAAAFVMIAALALAWLTQMSFRHSLGQMPLAALVAGCALAASGPKGLWTFFGGAVLYLAVILCLAWGRRSDPQRRLRPGQGIVAGLVAVLAVAFVLMDRRDTGCQALAGCNILSGVPHDASVLPLVPAFQEWNAARSHPDRPVHLVAAQGGGLYAAYATAMYLARRADQEGASFTDSLFAVSGVSGGSVGAAVYWAIRRSGLCADAGVGTACHQNAVRSALARDYLSPPLAGLLTRDLADTVLPYTSLFPQANLDRGSLMQQLLTRHVAEATGTADTQPALLDMAMAASFDPVQRGVPALFMNATDVHSGERIVSGPVTVPLNSEDSARRLKPGDGNELTVSEAAILSARFPVITPPGRVRQAGVTRQIVDGGYYDNSGVETVHDLLRVLLAADPDLRFEVIMLHDEGQPLDGRAPKGMLGAPLSAFTAAWTSRRQLSQRRLQDAMQDRFSIRMVPINDPESRINFTVSWFLGKASFCGIERGVAAALRQRPMFHDRVVSVTDPISASASQFRRNMLLEPPKELTQTAAARADAKRRAGDAPPGWCDEVNGR